MGVGPRLESHLHFSITRCHQNWFDSFHCGAFFLLYWQWLSFTQNYIYVLVPALIECHPVTRLCRFACEMENFNLWRVMEATLEADNTGNAQNSNLNNGNRRSRLALPPVTVFSRLILQQLMVISVFTILFNMVQFVCQGCLLIRSKRLSISLLNSCAVCWTFLIVVLVTRWLFILNRNQTEM